MLLASFLAREFSGGAIFGFIIINLLTAACIFYLIRLRLKRKKMHGEEASNEGARQGSLDIADEIEKLARLTQEGILTDEELARAKEMLLGRPQSHVDQSMHQLMDLNELKKQGVLSESEFNMKKWDILSRQDVN
jgi:hypothetical protein